MKTAAPMSDPLDLLDVSSLLSDEERDIQATVARFLDDRVRPHVGEWFDTCRFPRELAPELGRLGLLGMHLDG
jgi:glutaryl-CoA dehydrogenase